MIKMLKKNSKSIRMTDEVLNYVESFEGEGFNQKFENLVLFAMRTENDKKEAIRCLDQRIADRRNILSDLEKIDYALAFMRRQVHGLSTSVESLLAQAGAVPEEDSPDDASFSPEVVTVK